MIGKHIKNLRSQNNITQEQLAGKVGVARTTLASWEGDVHIPRLDEIIKLKNALHCTYEELIEGK